MRLSERLRPTQLSDLIQPPDVIAPLERMVRERTLMNMMFYGEPGIGKTSAARIVIASVEADDYEINGSLDAGIDTFRTDFVPWASSCSLCGGPKVCFIDECEKLSANAQAALRGVIEEYGHVTFLMTANDHLKLDAALRSRCRPTSFDILHRDYTEVMARLCTRYGQQLKEFGFAVDPARLAEIVHLDFPDLRAIANCLEFEFARQASRGL
jgi:replication-associated recombination protein RarA